ncbi:PD-(D/E)XK motif protein [Yinghuangia sp. YIM S09857]|uniref:PD-(D/E)XK motif protein n=1 Tax=Yinghuangia sp. YIM S09857 TaxID=3436929 RepID=UPI003F533DA2
MSVDALSGRAYDMTGSYGAWAEISHCIDVGEPRRIPVDTKDPHVEYFVGSDGERIGLRVEVDAEMRLPTSPLAAVKLAKVVQGGKRFMEISTVERELYRDFHDLLSGVAERVRSGANPVAAWGATVRSWNELLTRARTRSLTQELGLLGELFVLERLAAGYGWQLAVKSWRGSADEEHDFGLPDVDIEVKTTASERRVHRISGLTQLATTGDRELLLCSLQFTRGGASGRTLTSCIAALRAQIDAEAPAERDHFEGRLIAYGRLDDREQADEESWALRTRPAAYVVDGRFPRLTPDLLALPPEVRSHLVDVTYRIDVDNLACATSEVAQLLSASQQGEFVA